ncbi:MAG: Phospho-N-acetylmuramoyl-pentapeptide-transferase [Parcubacteria group bacterium GW2011_GWA2_44_12]|nr:MAG: Phospho-N-acetylmuramoyl-pentapeptide-transferase [Parcubacteria group bacterium GW2011_GWA2_44_12]
MLTSVIQIGVLGTCSFFVATALTPLVTHFLYKYKIGKQIRGAGHTPIFSALHEKKRGTPTMGGILIWGTVLIVTFSFAFISTLVAPHPIAKLDFFVRSETFLPLGMMIFAALIGLIDDLWGIKGKGKNEDGIRFRYKIVWYLLIGLVGGLWFFYKLNWDVVTIPLMGTYAIHGWYIPLFMFIITATGVSVNETDGLDGLAGGVLLCAFVAFGAIAFATGKVNLAALCAVISGALLSFVWFNIPPARFYMGDTGSMALGVTLGVIAMLTNSLFLLPIIGIIFVAEALSVILQILSRRLRNGKKIFKSAPLHHHLEAIGWSEPKIVMRFWVISGVFSVLGIIIALIDMKI